MGNWKERARAGAEAGRQERVIAERARAQIEIAEQRRQEQSKARYDAKKKEEELVRSELLSLFEKLEARKLLEEIRSEVWKEGEIDFEPTIKVSDGLGSLGMRFSCRGAYQDVGSHTSEPAGESGESTTHTWDNGWKVGILATSTEIILTKSSLVVKGVIEKKTEFSPENPDETKKILTDFLSEDCFERGRKGELPAQLRVKGKRMISEKVPWNRRWNLFS